MFRWAGDFAVLVLPALLGQRWVRHVAFDITFWGPPPVLLIVLCQQVLRQHVLRWDGLRQHASAQDPSMAPAQVCVFGGCTYVGG